MVLGCGPFPSGHWTSGPDLDSCIFLLPRHLVCTECAREEKERNFVPWFQIWSRLTKDMV
jgi:hypothetical protein